MAFKASKGIPKWASELGTLLAVPGAIGLSIAEQIVARVQAVNSK